MQITAYPLSFAVPGPQPVQLSATGTPVNFTVMNEQTPTLRAVNDPAAPSTRYFTIFTDNVPVPANATFIDSLAYQQNFYSLFETP